EVFTALANRLARCLGSFGGTPISKARRRAGYSKARHDLSPKFVRRISPVLDLLLSGKYRRYGHGWLNAIQDLFLRSVFKGAGR
ncbi:MAG: hypothetical protein MJ025_07190, partial [Victivallaceae bacterium]|nr:hypothetical protein [Victivallaceae bacterium]